MKTQISKQTCLVLFAAAIMIFSYSYAVADNLNPPAYVGNPLSVHAEWQVVFGATPLNLTQWSFVDDSDPTTNLYSIFLPTNPVQPNGDIYQLQLPNWVDQMPVKYMRLQLTWMGNPQPPVNIFSEGLDGTALISGVIVNTSPIQTLPPAFTYQYYDFEFHPNLDFERVHIQVAPNSVLSQIVIDTVSVPEPATMGLLALGSLVLRRRK